MIGVARLGREPLVLLTTGTAAPHGNGMTWEIARPAVAAERIGHALLPTNETL